MSLSKFFAGSNAVMNVLSIPLMLLTLWRADHVTQERDAALDQLRGAKSDFSALVGHYNRVAVELNNRNELTAQLAAITSGTQQLRDAIQGQGAKINQTLLELKRHDKAVAGFLALPVPAALGVRYARPASIDPLAWRAAAAAPGVQPDPVPAAGASGGGAR